ncbi:MAG: hypothetical protein KJO30_14335, partial [Boseongicola sp.]|nr:hypothetical protein [Boseongicola sp.]
FLKIFPIRSGTDVPFQTASTLRGLAPRSFAEAPLRCHQCCKEVPLRQDKSTAASKFLGDSSGDGFEDALWID